MALIRKVRGKGRKKFPAILDAVSSGGFHRPCHEISVRSHTKPIHHAILSGTFQERVSAETKSANPSLLRLPGETVETRGFRQVTKCG